MAALSFATLKQRAEKIKELSTLPTVMLRILEVMNNPVADARDVEREIMEDPVITAKVLKMANSAFYGANRDISSVSQAVVLMGFAEVQNIALSVSIFSRFAEPTKVFDRRQFWEHCFATAVTAEALQRRVNAQTNDGFVAGLLHDIGRVVLDQYFPNEFRDIIAMAETQKIPLLDAERKVLGVTHGDIGYWVAEKWRLPPLLTDAILFHHSPFSCRESYVLTSIVHVADVISKAFSGYMKDEIVPSPKDESAFRLLNLDSEKVMSLADLISKKMEYFDTLVGSFA
ncbi:MAG: HDOD domain-containing protein [Candidatus Abyssobacteria bacterium SURF_17]|jgi:putative nucleotidyltransferase with HDIG domain|uniref:HDOD domain-containing protein n=1 Tax=Candidatus Abyssobacteria bacterium SURF_17 TaxID=2093361 RepID=A0A419EX35_9BACT|nr:MAG: HDOD domain-containing protein [Candidatus Abyssubacteria bacterium SURF_17]